VPRSAAVMGNRLSGVRSRHKSGGGGGGDVSSPSTRTGGKSPASSAGGASVSVRLRAVAVRVGYRRGRSNDQIVSCPNLDDDVTAAGDHVHAHLGQ